jgi:hypothetical protein
MGNLMIATHTPEIGDLCKHITDPLDKLDCYIPRLGGTSRTEIMALFKCQTDEDIYIFGNNLVLKIDPQGIQSVYRKVSAKPMPSLTQQAMNFTKAVFTTAGAAATNKPVAAPEHIVKERLATCLGCSEYDSIRQKCAKCGCGTQRKIRLAPMECPLKKWTAYTDTKVTEPT